ncbi:DUF3164 family protein [Chitinimonas sp.]|uniref:DUF3164 family protein n=1 Tax=Chitinimonas sp. TaxID=1934313 RepID=UPI0035B3A47C
MEAMNSLPGYWPDASGNLIREDLIKPIDRERDALVKKLVAGAKAVSTQLADYKLAAFADIAALVELSAEQYGAKVGGKKGNVTLYTFDGRYKVQRAMADSIVFDERLQAAKALIDQCLDEWTADSRPELKAIINNAFSVDKEGNLNTGRVLGLKRLDIQDVRWQSAMAAIGDAVQVVGSKAYVRVYERVGDSDMYRPIPLNVAEV